jgi:hypothetical protein
VVTKGCRVIDRAGEFGEGTVAEYEFDVWNREWRCLVDWDKVDAGWVPRSRVELLAGDASTVI